MPPLLRLAVLLLSASLASAQGTRVTVEIPLTPSAPSAAPAATLTAPSLSPGIMPVRMLAAPLTPSAAPAAPVELPQPLPASALMDSQTRAAQAPQAAEETRSARDEDSESLATSGRKQFDNSSGIETPPVAAAAAPPRSIDSFRALTKSAFEAWIDAPNEGERQRLRKEFMALGKELDRAKADEKDPVAREALKTFIREEWNPQRRAIVLAGEPEFVRMLGLPLGAQQRGDAIQLMARIRWGDAAQARGVAAHLEKLKSSGPHNAEAGIEELYQAEVWKGRLAANLPSFQISYLRNAGAMNLYSSVYKYYAAQAREARARGEMIMTGGRQGTRRQTRGTCPYNAACNLFAEDISETRLTPKDILREAYRLNPTFASRPGAGAPAVNGLSFEAILDMSQALAARVGKKTVSLELGDLIRFMAARKTPVMITFRSWDEKLGPYAHVLLLGNPFVFRDLQGERNVVFEAYDSNYPKDVVSYIDAETVAQLMKDRGIALLDAQAAASR